MKLTSLLAATLCMFAWSESSIAAGAPPISAIYQHDEDFPARIVGLKFKETKTGRIIAYPSKDEAAAEMGSLFYKPVFSPSGEWMFLPVGQFDGFIFFPTRRWREGLVQGTGTRFYVKSPFGPAEGHRFAKWLGGDEVRVTIGGEFDFSEIDINLRTHKAKVIKGTFPAEWLHFAEVRGSAQTKKHAIQK